MKINKAYILAALFAFVLVAVYAGQSVAGEKSKWVGTITPDSQFSSEAGEMYQLADTEIARELYEHAGKKVEIKGTVSEEEGKKVISVSSYEILEE